MCNNIIMKCVILLIMKVIIIMIMANINVKCE